LLNNKRRKEQKGKYHLVSSASINVTQEKRRQHRTQLIVHSIPSNPKSVDLSHCCDKEFLNETKVKKGAHEKENFLLHETKIDSTSEKVKRWKRGKV